MIKSKMQIADMVKSEAGKQVHSEVLAYWEDFQSGHMREMVVMLENYIKSLVYKVYSDGCLQGWKLGNESALVRDELFRGLSGVDEGAMVAGVRTFVSDEDIREFAKKEFEAAGGDSHTLKLSQMAIGVMVQYDGWTKGTARERVSQMIICRRIAEAAG